MTASSFSGDRTPRGVPELARTFERHQRARVRVPLSGAASSRRLRLTPSTPPAGPLLGTLSPMVRAPVRNCPPEPSGTLALDRSGSAHLGPGRLVHPSQGRRGPSPGRLSPALGRVKAQGDPGPVAPPLMPKPHGCVAGSCHHMLGFLSGWMAAQGPRPCGWSGRTRSAGYPSQPGRVVSCMRQGACAGPTIHTSPDIGLASPRGFRPLRAGQSGARRTQPPMKKAPSCTTS